MWKSAVMMARLVPTMINANSATRRAHTHEQRRLGLGLMAILILTERRIYSYLRLL